MSWKDGILTSDQWDKIAFIAGKLAPKYRGLPFADGLVDDLKKELRTANIAPNVIQHAQKRIDESE